MQCQGGRSMFNLLSLQSIGLPWNTEWKISKPGKERNVRDCFIRKLSTHGH